MNEKPTPLKKTTQLKQMLTTPGLNFICEAHNGISARIVEEVGFKGIWASGLTISGSLGVRDNNEASWTQVLELVEFMSDATNVPILLDGDTGYGNFNNLRRLVAKLESRQVAGVCIEDKLFPKTNSFIEGEKQSLADLDEFCGKIKAGKDTQKDDDFVIVARTESFIVGAGLKEALRRAEAYRQAGADAILVHSKKHTPDDIEAFMQEWANRHPIVVVPTTYYSTPTRRFDELGISLVIWANQILRSAVTAMHKSAEDIFNSSSIKAQEDRIAPVSEIFRLQGAKELQLAEEKYLPGERTDCKAIILAASRGEALGDLTEDRPKAMLPINGKPIIDAYVDELRALHIGDISVVRGYKKESLSSAAYRCYDNDRYQDTGELFSLYQAREQLQGNVIVSYGDCLFRSHILRDLLESPAPATVIVDAEPGGNSRNKDMAHCNRPYSNDFFNHNIELERIERENPSASANGEWTGLLMLGEQSSPIARQLLEEMAGQDGFEKLGVPDLINRLTAHHPIRVIYTKGGWININDMNDFIAAGLWQ
ncbi:MAG: phosphoenolpyruvate mutase [Methylobacter sp.]